MSSKLPERTSSMPQQTLSDEFLKADTRSQHHGHSIKNTDRQKSKYKKKKSPSKPNTHDRFNKSQKSSANHKDPEGAAIFKNRPENSLNDEPVNKKDPIYGNQKPTLPKVAGINLDDETVNIGVKNKNSIGLDHGPPDINNHLLRKSMPNNSKNYAPTDNKDPAISPVSSHPNANSLDSMPLDNNNLRDGRNLIYKVATPQEIDRLFKIYRSKKYLSGWLYRKNDITPEGNPYSNNDWSLVFAEICGSNVQIRSTPKEMNRVVASLADTGGVVIDVPKDSHTAKKIQEMTVAIIPQESMRIRDAQVNWIGIFRKMRNSKSYRAGILSLNSIGANRFYFQPLPTLEAPDTPQDAAAIVLQLWVGSLRLAIFEDILLNMCFTESLLFGVPALNECQREIYTITELGEQKIFVGGYLKVKLSGTMGWKRLYCVVEKRDLSVTTSKKKKKNTLVGSALGHGGSGGRGHVIFFHSAKDAEKAFRAPKKSMFGKKKSNLSALSLAVFEFINVAEAFAVFPEDPHDVSEAFIFKICGGSCLLGGQSLDDMRNKKVHPTYDFGENLDEASKQGLSDWLNSSSFVTCMAESELDMAKWIWAIWNVFDLHKASSVTSSSSKQMLPLLSMKLGEFSNFFKPDLFIPQMDILSADMRKTRYEDFWDTFMGLFEARLAGSSESSSSVKSPLAGSARSPSETITSNESSSSAYTDYSGNSSLKPAYVKSPTGSKAVASSSTTNSTTSSTSVGTSKLAKDASSSAPAKSNNDSRQLPLKSSKHTSKSPTKPIKNTADSSMEETATFNLTSKKRTVNPPLYSGSSKPKAEVSKNEEKTTFSPSVLSPSFVKKLPLIFGDSEHNTSVTSPFSDFSKALLSETVYPSSNNSGYKISSAKSGDIPHGNHSNQTVMRVNSAHVSQQRLDYQPDSSTAKKSSSLPITRATFDEPSSNVVDKQSDSGSFRNRNADSNNKLRAGDKISMETSSNNGSKVKTNLSSHRKKPAQINTSTSFESVVSPKSLSSSSSASSRVQESRLNQLTTSPNAPTTATSSATNETASTYLGSPAGKDFRSASEIIKSPRKKQENVKQALSVRSLEERSSGTNSSQSSSSLDSFDDNETSSKRQTRSSRKPQKIRTDQQSFREGDSKIEDSDQKSNSSLPSSEAASSVVEPSIKSQLPRKRFEKVNSGPASSVQDATLANNAPESSTLQFKSNAYNDNDGGCGANSNSSSSSGSRTSSSTPAETPETSPSDANSSDLMSTIAIERKKIQKEREMMQKEMAELRREREMLMSMRMAGSEVGGGGAAWSVIGAGWQSAVTANNSNSAVNAPDVGSSSHFPAAASSSSVSSIIVPPQQAHSMVGPNTAFQNQQVHPYFLHHAPYNLPQASIYSQHRLPNRQLNSSANSVATGGGGSSQAQTADQPPRMPSPTPSESISTFGMSDPPSSFMPPASTMSYHYPGSGMYFGPPPIPGNNIGAAPSNSSSSNSSGNAAGLYMVPPPHQAAAYFPQMMDVSHAQQQQQTSNSASLIAQQQAAHAQQQQQQQQNRPQEDQPRGLISAISANKNRSTAYNPRLGYTHPNFASGHQQQRTPSRQPLQFGTQNPQYLRASSGAPSRYHQLPQRYQMLAKQADDAGRSDQSAFTQSRQQQQQQYQRSRST